MNDDARATLQSLCSERGESLAGLSRLLGRNDAYIQQYLRNGREPRSRTIVRVRAYLEAAS